jgi:chorismate synthase
MKPLRSVDLSAMSEAPAVIERSDVCAISAAAVVGEAVVSLVLADAFLEKFSGDSLGEIERNYAAATSRLQTRFSTPGSQARVGGPD